MLLCHFLSLIAFNLPICYLCINIYYLCTQKGVVPCMKFWIIPSHNILFTPTREGIKIICLSAAYFGCSCWCAGGCLSWRQTGGRGGARLQSSGDWTRGRSRTLTSTGWNLSVLLELVWKGCSVPPTVTAPTGDQLFIGSPRGRDSCHAPEVLSTRAMCGWSQRRMFIFLTGHGRATAGAELTLLERSLDEPR
jgi:hypothetical protein